MDVSSLYTNIPQEDGPKHYAEHTTVFTKQKSQYPTQLLKRALRPIMQGNNSMEKKNYLQTKQNFPGN